MIASELRLDRAAMKALRVTDPYSVHRVVYSLFDDTRDDARKKSSEASGILYADRGGDVRLRRILILSDRHPAPTVDGTHGAVESKPVPENFLDHDRYRFSVIVNPTRRDNASRKLVPAQGREAVAEWFIERAGNSWGFSPSIPHLTVGRMSVMRFRDKRERPVTIGTAVVEGSLTVADRDRFRESFQRGIGRARAFGCGLMQIIPLSE